MPSYVTHKEATGTQTYTFDGEKPRYVDIQNTGDAALTFRTDTMDDAMTVPIGKPIGGFLDFGEYSSITITATSTFIFVASR